MLLIHTENHFYIALKLIFLREYGRSVKMNFEWKSEKQGIIILEKVLVLHIVLPKVKST